MMLRVFILLLLLLGAHHAQGQTFQKLLSMGDESLNEDPGQALAYYQKAFQIDSNSVDAIFRYAQGLRVTNQYGKAAFYYESAYKRTLGKLYPESILYLALMQKMNGQYKDAVASWKKATRVFRDKKSYEYLKAKEEQKHSRWAEFESRKTPAVSPKMMEGNLPTCNAEMAASLLDGTTYFTRYALSGPENRLEKYRIVKGKMEGDGITQIEELPLHNNDALHYANAVFSPDGNRMYFTRCGTARSAKNKDTGCRIMVAWKNGDGWAEAEEIGGLHQPGYSETHPSVSLINGKEYLFFSSDRPGSAGGYDIWYCTIKDGNEYGKIIHAGKDINSPEDEVTPFYDTTTNALFFSSSFHKGFGGHDIQFATGAPGKWKTIENAGWGINSPVNDLYFRRYGKVQLLTSNRNPENAQCCSNLYIIREKEKPVVEDPYESLEDLFTYLPVTLYFHNDRPNPNSLDTFTTLNYLDTYHAYRDLSPTYREEYSKGLEGSEAQEARALIDTFFVNKVDKGVKDLELFAKLLLRELEKGQDIELTIQGFASPLAATKYNVGLTKRRISSLVNYLYAYQNRVMAPYLDGNAENGGSLSFVFIPFGEYSADQGISDNPNDQKNSVYSRNAALERKIEIQKVKLVSKTETQAEIRFSTEIHDFGDVKPGTPLSFHFPFGNAGTDTLEITGIEPQAQGIDAETSIYEIAPGEKGTITIEVDTTDMKGLKVLKVRILTNGIPEEKELMVTFEVNK